MGLSDSEKIPYISDENAYNEYAALKPKTKYLYTKVKFLCRGCNRETVKTFRTLTSDLLCSSCTSKNTCIEKYGVDNYSKTSECMNKMKQTCLDRYGVDNYVKTKEYKVRQKKTVNERYGVDNVMQSDVVKNKIKTTCIERYGVDNVFKSDIVKEKIRSTARERYGVDHYMQSNIGQEKARAACIEKYGTVTYSQTDECKDKVKQTNLLKYGSEYYLQTDDFKEKSMRTCIDKYGASAYLASEQRHDDMRRVFIEKYGVENPMQVESVKEKSRQTSLLKYGFENPAMSEEVKEKYRHTCLEKYGTTNYCLSDEYSDKFQVDLTNRLRSIGLEMLSRDDSRTYMRCIECGHEFSYSNGAVFNFLNHYCSNFCPGCSRKLINGRSLKEKALLDYIRSIYTGTVIENDRTVIKPKELDIYLPELNLAFEFNGTYWHADPMFYTEYDYIEKKGMTAGEIWEYDRVKLNECVVNNIELHVIKEYDWDHENARILAEIKEYIG